MQLSSLSEFVLVLLGACIAVAACMVVAHACRLDRLAHRLGRSLTQAPDDAFSKLIRLAFPAAGVLLVVTLVGLGLMANPIWAATTLVFLCAGMTAFVISAGRTPARVECRAEQRDSERPALKKAA